METIDQLGHYLMCPNLSIWTDVLVTENHFRWNTFQHSEQHILRNIEKLIAKTTYDIICQILIDNNDPIYKTQKSLSEYEEKYNKKVLGWSESNREVVAKVAAGWVRLVLIYKKIIELSENYKFILPNLSAHKRIFKENPVTIDFSIPAIFADEKTNSFDVLLITPSVSKHPTARSWSLYNYFVLDFCKQSKMDITEILEISFDERSVSRDFQFNRYWINDHVYKNAETFFESLQNNERPNVHYCNSCPVSSKCTAQLINRKVHVLSKYESSLQV